MFICTGNRARSPFATELLRRHAETLPVVVSSFGTRDLGSVPALPEAMCAAKTAGIDLASHRARPLSAGDLTSADLAVGFEPFHVAAAVMAGGAAKERAFLITELAGFLDEIGLSRDPLGASRPEHMVELANARRAAGNRSAQSVADPVGGSKEEFRRVFKEIIRLVETIAVGLFGDRVAVTEGGKG